MSRKVRCDVRTFVHIRVPAQKVWSALVQVEHIRIWWGASRGLVEARKGGLWALAWSDGSQGYRYVLSGVVRTTQPGRRLLIDPLIYFNSERAPLGPMRVSFSLADHRGSTRVTARQQATGEGADWEWYLGTVKQGWKASLANLKNFLEKGS